MGLRQLIEYARNSFWGQSDQVSGTSFSHVRTAYDFYYALATTAPQSDQRREILRYVVDNMYPTVKTGANISNISPNGQSVIVNQRVNRSGKLDGRGPEGGLSEAGEHPLITVLRESIEERCDKGVVNVSSEFQIRKEHSEEEAKSIAHARDSYIKQQADLFAESFKELGLVSETTDRKLVASQLQTLKDRGAIFRIFDDEFTFDGIELTPQGGIFDLSFMMGVTLENNRDYFKRYMEEPEKLKKASISDEAATGIRFTSPFQFVRFHKDQEKFLKHAKAGSKRAMSGEVAGTDIMHWTRVADRILYEGPDKETESMRYTHEGLGMLWGVIQAGGADAETVIRRLEPNIKKIAEAVNSSPEEIREWLRSGSYGSAPTVVSGLDDSAPSSSR